MTLEDARRRALSTSGLSGPKRRTIQWTHSASKDQHLYFTTPSVTADDRWLVIISERDGGPNLYAIERRTGAIHALTENKNGLMRSYVYPTGGVRGFCKSSPCLDAVRGYCYCIVDGCVRKIEVANGRSKTLTELPTGSWAAYNDVSPDGRWLCVPCADGAAFPEGLQTQWDQMRVVPERFEATGAVTHIILIDTETGASRVQAEVPFWVSHVQFDPRGSGRIVHNREGQGALARPRIWCLETDGASRPLSTYPEQVIWSHENWSPDGQSIVYHGWETTSEKTRAFAAARTWEGALTLEVEMPGFSLGHVVLSNDGSEYITDGVEGHISLLRHDNEGWTTEHLCWHGTDPSLKDQDAHAHPKMTPDGKGIIFTSDRGGVCNVYEVRLQEGS